jgi:hypothetical protein
MTGNDRPRLLRAAEKGYERGGLIFLIANYRRIAAPIRDLR